MSLLVNRYSYNAMGMKVYASCSGKWLNKPKKQSEMKLRAEYVSAVSGAERSVQVSAEDHKSLLYELLNNADIWKADGTCEFQVGDICYTAQLDLWNSCFVVNRDYMKTKADAKIEVNIPESTRVDYSFGFEEEDGKRVLWIQPYDSYNPFNQHVFFYRNENLDENVMLTKDMQYREYDSLNGALFEFWKQSDKSYGEHPESKVWINGKVLTFANRPGTLVEVYDQTERIASLPYSCIMNDQNETDYVLFDKGKGALVIQDKDQAVCLPAEKEKEMESVLLENNADGYMAYEKYGCREVRMENQNGKKVLVKKKSTFWSDEDRKEYYRNVKRRHRKKSSVYSLSS